MLTGNDLLIFDTSSLLDLYRHSLITSKRLLDYVKSYEDKIWIPNQVKKEVIKNRDKAKNIYMYKKFKSSTIKESDKLKNQISKYINGYSKSGFLKLDELDENIKLKFEEINNIIKEYDESIKDESEIYKDFILGEVDPFLDNLLSGDKVGSAFNIVEIMDIIKEGELRYKYKIAPGFEDEKDKIGIDKFGDLIVWKQIINKAVTIDNDKIYFITSDNKPDWFKYIDNKYEPCRELIEEFNHYVENKEINIVTMSDFIEMISSSTNQSDVQLLTELRKEIVIKNIEYINIEEIIRNKVEESQAGILNYTPNDIENNTEVSNAELEKSKISSINLIFEDDIVTYKVNFELNLYSSTTLEDIYTVEHGEIDFKGNVDIYIHRDMSITEREFIDSIKINKNEIISVGDINIEESEYRWLGSLDKDKEVISDAYTTCPKCGEGINFRNDAGNSYCIDCTREYDL